MEKNISGKKRKFLPISITLIVLSMMLINLPSLLSLVQETKKKETGYDISVSAISLAVTVQNKSGKYINDFTLEDFSVYENEEKKEITYFSHDYEAPLSFTVLLDVSGSMALQDKLKDCKEALHYFVSSLFDNRDELSLLIFADGEVEVAVRFSNDRNAFSNVLENTEAYGQTALNDAVAVSPNFANRGSNEKRALLLITDGIENDSQFSLDQAVEVARRVDIPIYTIGYKIPLSEQFLEKYKRSPSLTALGIVDSLDEFSGATGGEAYFINRVNELKSVLRSIKKDLSHQYIIGYTSYQDPKNGHRKIKVLTSKKRYVVRTREGYYSGEKKAP
ncbi:MAG: VWA domain-containing protein [Candidatus Aminicenantes bacterium]|nr:VWA domain-containing protein [Candidatus Aminicenantes bacterium]